MTRTMQPAWQVPRDVWVRTARAGGKSTEVAARAIVQSPPGDPAALRVVGREELVSLAEGAFVVPPTTSPGGVRRPERRYTIAVLRSDRDALRILAYYQPRGRRLSPLDVLGDGEPALLVPEGGLMGRHGEVLDAYLDPGVRGASARDTKGRTLLAALVETARAHGLRKPRGPFSADARAAMAAFAHRESVCRALRRGADVPPEVLRDYPELGRRRNSGGKSSRSEGRGPRRTRVEPPPYDAPENIRCTEATLRALGVEGQCPIYGVGVLGALTNAGIRWRPYGMGPKWAEEEQWLGRTLRSFVAAHPRGRFYLSTRSHAMALVDGRLTDTAARGADGRRLVAIVEVLDRPARRENPGLFVLAPHEYPASPEADRSARARFVRQVAHDLKVADARAIHVAAGAMAPLLPPGSTLVPVPSSSGSTRANLRLAEAIASLVPGTHVVDGLDREASESQYRRRKRGEAALRADAMRVRWVGGALRDPVVLIDNVLSTGATAKAAERALGRDTLALVWADARKVT